MAGEPFTTKLGPLPAWAWGLLAGGAVLAAMALRDRNRTAAPPPDPDPAAGTPDEGTDDSDLFFGEPPPIWSPGRVPAPAPVPAPPAPAPPPPTFRTNDAWRQHVIRWAIEQGHPGPKVSNTVANYLDGAALDWASERPIMLAIVNEFGPPPDNPPPFRWKNRAPSNPPPVGTNPPRDVRR